METTLAQFALGLSAAGITAMLAIFIHYEGLALIHRHILPASTRHRRTLFFMMLAVFALHCAEIWVFAGVIGLLDLSGAGHLAFNDNLPAGVHGIHYVYYATICYTSIGFGDIIPTGALRMLSGAAGLTGLLLIAWSASFTYLMMEKFWNRK